jgi:chromosomal replication initiation ATPase DnaA
MTPTSLTETTLTLGTKNEFSRDYIKDHYIPFLIDAAKAVTGKKIEIFIETLHDEPEEKEPLSPKAKPAEIPVSSQPPLFPSEAAASPSYSSISHFTPIAPGDNSSLKEKYTSRISSWARPTGLPMRRPSPWSNPRARCIILCSCMAASASARRI